MTDFLDLPKALHHGCVSGDRTRLAHCQAWLATAVAIPRDETGWHQLGTGPVDWLTPLPMGWEPQWRILSPRERTLTVDALEYLDTHPPGAVAAALPPSPTAAPEAPPLWDVPVHGSLSDVMDCICREVHRREAQYPIQMQQDLLSAEQALQELGQMKAALRRADRLGRPRAATPVALPGRDEADTLGGTAPPSPSAGSHPISSGSRTPSRPWMHSR